MYKPIFVNCFFLKEWKMVKIKRPLGWSASRCYFSISHPLWSIPTQNKSKIVLVLFMSVAYAFKLKIVA